MLRDYQLNAIEQWSQAVKSGRRFTIIQLSTGTGKTKLATEVVKSHSGRTLWLASRLELIDQAAEELTEAGLDVGCLSGGGTFNPYKPVQVGSIQTLQRRELRPDATLIVADECRHYVSDKWKDVLQYYKSAGANCIALDATPVRADGRGLGDIYDELIQGPTVQWFTDNNYLVPCEILAPKRVLDPRTIAKSPVDAYKAHAGARKAIVYAANIKAAEEYTRDFKRAGIAAELITAQTDIATRRSHIAGYKGGFIRVLVNVGVLTEGFDDPETAIGILARSVGSISLYLQIVGRLLRTYPGKERALLVDLFGSSKIFGPPNNEWVYSLDGDGVKLRVIEELRYKFCAVCSYVMPPNATICPECLTERQLPGAPDIVNAELVKFEWIRKDPPQQRIDRIAKWIAKADSMGYKRGSVWYKAKATYGSPPTKEEWQAAIRLANASKRK